MLSDATLSLNLPSSLVFQSVLTRDKTNESKEIMHNGKTAHQIVAKTKPNGETKTKKCMNKFKLSTEAHFIL